MKQNSSIHSLKQKRAQSARKNPHFVNNLESLANDIKTIEDNLNTLKQTSRQNSLTRSQNKQLLFKGHTSRKRQSKNRKRKSPLRENNDYGDYYARLDKPKKKSRTIKEDQKDALIKDLFKDNLLQSQPVKQKNPADIVSKFHADMLSYICTDQRPQFELLLKRIIKLL